MKKGFTLAEVAVVVVIVGIITAFALPNYFRSLEKGKERTAAANVMQAGIGVKSWQAATSSGSFNSNNLNTINATLRTDIMLEDDQTLDISASQGAWYASITWTNGGTKGAYVGPLESVPCCPFAGTCLALQDC